MEKTIVALRARNGPEQIGDVVCTVSQLRDWASASGAIRFAVDLPADEATYELLGRRPTHAPEWNVVAHLWHEADALALGHDDAFDAIHVLRVAEQIAWNYDRDWADGIASPGVKQISFVGKRSDLTDDEFARHYRAHVDVARIHHSGVWKYAQNIVVRMPGDPSTTGSISEFWFRSVDDLINRYYTFADSSAITRADSANFLDVANTTWMLVQEHWLQS